MASMGAAGAAPAKVSGFGLLAYGALGFPLALASLPLYVHLPQFYGSELGVPLSLAGAVLLAMRMLAACADPLIGLAIDRSGQRFLASIVMGAPLLAAGFIMLFMPPASIRGGDAVAWMALGLAVIYAGHGAMSIAHQGWGAALATRVRVRAWLPAAREGFGLAGVVLAAAVAGSLGYPSLSVLLLAALGACLLLLGAARSLRHVGKTTGLAAPLLDGVRIVFRNVQFRRLFLILLVNGTASAIPATLFMFFVGDHLGMADRAPSFLIAYFVAAACSLPAWTFLASRVGEARAWLLGMCGSILIFMWTALIGAGAGTAFMAVCMLSGLMLGAELAVPTALLAGVIHAAGHTGRHDAAYFGAWNWGVQMTLALAAGAALPLLDLLGYVPGSPAKGLGLVAVYCLLPCVLKLIAVALLWRAPLNQP